MSKLSTLGKTQSKVGSKVSTVFKLKKPSEANLVGNNKKQFEDIPDSASQFTKITGARDKMYKKNPVVKEDKLTAKPNEIIMSGTNNLATVKEHNFTGHKAQKEVTDKPNNIRAATGLTGGLRF